MSRSQAIAASLAFGFVLLGLIGVIVLLLYPFEQVFGPVITPAATFTPRPTATATFPSFLPTPSNETALPPEPSPTNTRVPTVTPQPTATPRPTGQVVFPTPAVRPTATPLPPAPGPPPATPSPTSTLPPPRGYEIFFEAEETTLTPDEECTDLVWRVEGLGAVQLNGQGVNSSDRRKVCPDEDAAYTLTIQRPDSAQIERRTVEIRVEDEE